MPMRRIPMDKVREIIRLNTYGKLNHRAIARALNISRPIVVSRSKIIPHKNQTRVIIIPQPGIIIIPHLMTIQGHNYSPFFPE